MSKKNMHNHLLAIVPRRDEDYDPWGTNERWKDPKLACPDCSSGCKHYLVLDGELGADWGVCSNPKSHRAGLLTFEHQGCQKFELERGRR